MQREAYLAWMQGGYTVKKTHSNQLSRIRRLEKAFSTNLDDAFAGDGMASILNMLEYGAADAAASKPLPPGIKSKGDRSSTMSTLRHAARQYLAFLTATQPALAQPIPSGLVPLHTPKSAPMRKLRPTGYWFFSASPGIWDVDRWAQEEEDRLLYYVGEDDRSMIQVGDLGLIKRNVWRYRKSAIMAIVEVVEPVGVRPETDIRFFVDPDEGAQPDHRVALEVLAIPAPPIQISFLPNTAEYKYLHKGLQRTTTPISRAVFEHVAALAGISGEDVRAARGARSRAGVRQLERSADDLTPKARSRTSKVIERGPIGARVKAARKNCCQVCEALGRHPIAFQKRHGGGFSEAHHVMPVAHLIRGSLGAENIMVLCPNHHRQAHHGRFEIVNDDGLVWTVEIDGKKFKIERTIL